MGKGIIYFNFLDEVGMVPYEQIVGTVGRSEYSCTSRGLYYFPTFKDVVDLHTVY